MGNLLAVKLLFTQGRLVGSRLQLIQETMVSGNLALLDWIQAHISETVPASSNSSFVLYRGPYVTACGGEHAVCVSDWLTANGYSLPLHASEVDASASLFGRPAARQAMLETTIQQYHEHKVAVLDWLLAHCFTD
ncbi:hypothetical protein BCR44DRAFT_1438702 [Catenaria anguillulae PL171]|uniref:Uncharacterized protein n=1 Tax=Catenaria anguillulae PL171 TaxID=765915 RepID=A0A1Y2HHD4_9FUNG|nr:hypothetical protein BCR44DRAFT_1438702 [Catenaria anguillulae PL171]